MRIAVYGAGAIGGYLGARLSLGGYDVTLIARGAHLRAMQASGVRLIERGEECVAHPACTDDPRSAGRFDYLVLALKAHQVPEALGGITTLLGPDTAVVTAQNGVPWWYFYRFGGVLEGTRLQSVDAGGKIWDAIGPQRAIGCVVYPACEIVEPGVIRHIEGERLTLGEPDGSRSARARELSRALTGAGFKAPVSAHVRTEVWVKLWGNAVFNPISVLTRATLREVCRQPSTRAYAATVMAEVAGVAEALGERMPVSVEARIKGAEAVGEHKTSMLQDYEQGRLLELDAVTGAVVELGRLTGVATPGLEGLYGMTRLLAARGTRA